VIGSIDISMSVAVEGGGVEDEDGQEHKEKGEEGEQMMMSILRLPMCYCYRIAHASGGGQYAFHWDLENPKWRGEVYMYVYAHVCIYI
jgi:hypothetical protein